MAGYKKLVAGSIVLKFQPYFICQYDFVFTVFSLISTLLQAQCYFFIFLTLTAKASAGFLMVIRSISSRVNPSLNNNKEKEVKRSE